MVAIIVGAIAIFAFGALWFTVLFGRIWAELMGFTNDKMSASEQAKEKAMGMTKPLILNFITNVVIASVVYYLFSKVSAVSLSELTILMLVIWLGFSFPIYANQAIWERKSWKLVLINSLSGILTVVILTSVIYFLR